jgi:glucose-6-phosphate dehydrogenase assembly protein OpcA
VAEPSPPKSGSVAVLTFGTPATRYGVELLAVHAACADRSIPSILCGLVIGDLPTAVWWTDDFSSLSAAEPSPAITAMGQQFLYDSAKWSDVARGLRAVAALLGRPHRPDIADLNWRRLRTLRRCIVHSLRAEVNARGTEPSQIVVHHRAGRGALAWLTVGWLHSRIGAPAAAPEEVGSLDAELTVLLSGPSWRLEASMKGSTVIMSANGRPPFAMSIPGETEADAVASELLALSRDAPLEDAVTAAADLA